MDSLRLIPVDRAPDSQPCCRCAEDKGHWDLIAGKPYCPNCQESLVVGEAEPLIERTRKHRCAVCSRIGTLDYLTFPLQSETPVAMELCSEHLRSLLGRRLGTYAYQQLRRQLRALGLRARDLFLLHDAFYDSNGRALQPAIQLE